MKLHHFHSIVLLSLLLTGISAYTNETTSCILTGKVFDCRSNKPLSNAEILLKELHHSIISDSNGVFSLQNLVPGIYTVTVFKDGYDTTIVPNVTVKSKKNDFIVITLQKSTVQTLDKIVVVSNRLEVKNIDQFHSVTRLSNFELNNTAATFNDINRTLEYIPGVLNQINKEYFNDFSVRGGGPSENVFVVDNIELENPSHFGLFGTNGGYLNIINSSYVQELDFYAGAQPVKYTPRLSSVTDIRLREGSRLNRKYNIEFNNFMLGFATEGPFPKAIGSYLINGQAFNLNLMKNFMEWDDVPALHNYQLKLHFPFGDNQVLVLNALGAHDIMTDREPDRRIILGETQKAYIFSQHGSALQWNIFNESFRNEFITSFLYRRLGENENFTDAYEKKYGFKEVAECSDIRKGVQVKNNSSIFLGEKNQIDFGFSLERKIYGIRERMSCIDDQQFWKFSQFIITDEWLEGYLENNGDDSSYITGDTITYMSGVDQASVKEHEETGDRIGGYFDYIFRNDLIKLGIGVRGDYYTLVHKPGISPRLYGSYRIGKLGTISINAGILHQFPILLEPWLFSKSTGGSLSTFELQRCSQGGFGFEKTFKKVYRFSVEGYYKWYDREFEYTDPDGPQLIGTLVGNDQEDLKNRPEQHGKKRSYGIELLMKKMQFNKFYFSVGYSFNVTENRYTNNKWYPDAQNRRNSGFCIIGTNYFRHHGLALTINAGEGVPYSTMKTVRDSSFWDNGDVNYFYRFEYSGDRYWMNKRFDPYFLIGVRYSFRVFPPWGNVTGYIDIQNILNREIPYAPDYDSDTGEITFQRGNGLLPMFGIVFDL